MSEPIVRASADLRLLRAAVFAAACVALSAVGHTVAADGHLVPVWTLGIAAVLVFLVAAPLAGRERSLPGIAAGLALGQVALHALFGLGQGISASRADDGGQRLVDLARTLLCNDRMASGLTEPRARQLLSDAGLGHLTTAHQSGAGATGHTEHLAGGADLVSGLDGFTAWNGLQLALRGVLAMASGPMLLGHLAAALATGMLLRRGEAALWRLVRLSAVAADELLLRSLRDALHWVRACGSERTDAVRPVRSTSYRPPLTPAEPEALRHSVTRRGPPCPRDDLALTA